MKIYKDSLGLYTVCGGWISRPFFGTLFKEGDKVKTHHFGGSTNVGVTFPDSKECNFTKNGKYEIWSTTGVSNFEYKNKTIKLGLDQLFGSTYSTFDEFLKLSTDWYKEGTLLPDGVTPNGIAKFRIFQNEEFKEHFKK